MSKKKVITIDNSGMRKLMNMVNTNEKALQTKKQKISPSVL